MKRQISKYYCSTCTIIKREKNLLPAIFLVKKKLYSYNIIYTQILYIDNRNPQFNDFSKNYPKL